MDNNLKCKNKYGNYHRFTDDKGLQEYKNKIVIDHITGEEWEVLKEEYIKVIHDYNNGLWQVGPLPLFSVGDIERMLIQKESLLNYEWQHGTPVRSSKSIKPADNDRRMIDSIGKHHTTSNRDMGEQEVRDLWDEYSRESGFEFHVVPKRWAILPAKELSNQENEALKKQVEDNQYMVNRAKAVIDIVETFDEKEEALKKQVKELEKELEFYKNPPMMPQDLPAEH